VRLMPLRVEALSRNFSWVETLSRTLVWRARPAQMRALCRRGVALRWVAIAFGSLAGLLAPRVPPFLQAEIVAALAYNGLVMLAVTRAKDTSLPAMALVMTVIDLLFCFVFIGIYNVLPGSQQVAAYVPGMLEAVAFFGIAGAILSVGVFVTGVLLVQAGILFWRGSFDNMGLLEVTMLIILVAICLAGVHEVLTRPQEDVVSDDQSRRLAMSLYPLSDRDQEVLRLVARGSSNATIANQLGVSERMVKKSVERLLTQLHARTRAEAVAAASRLQLL
jgi:DNA-binding CsgD family transcriptional regulator